MSGGVQPPPSSDPRYDNIQAVWQSFDRFQAVLSPEAVNLLSKTFNLDAIPYVRKQQFTSNKGK
jgi:hypothetical protein